MKRIHEIFEDEMFDRIERVKDRSGMGWREFICEAAKAYDEKSKATAANAKEATA